MTEEIKTPEAPEKAKEEKKDSKKESVKKDILMTRNGEETKCSNRALKSFLEAGWSRVGKE